MLSVSRTVASRRVAQQGVRSFASTTVPSIQHVVQKDSSVEVDWGNGVKGEFSSVWLRDHAPETLHPTSLQRQLDSASFSPDDSKVNTVATTGSGYAVRVEWASGKLSGVHSDFTSEFLFEHGYSDELRAARKELKGQAFDASLWDASYMNKDTIPKADSAELMASESKRLALLQQLAQYGTCMVTNMAQSIEETEEVVRKVFGAPRETFYGAMWDTAPKNEADINDTAYTKDALHPHTDTCYLTDSPGLQIFNCVAQSTPNESANLSTEGATKLVDGFKIIDILKEKYPDTYEFFLNTPLKWHSLEEGVHVSATEPVIKLDPITAKYRQYRYNSYDLAPINYLAPHQVDAFYRHNRIMNELLRSEENIALVRMEVGDMIVVNNHRVCHGRTAFVGYRNLVGCYVGKDDWESKLRVHGGKTASDMC